MDLSTRVRKPVSSTESTSRASTKRGRGRPARVSRSSIIEAARALPPETLSMQAVADSLGVDRSTINYHFADREELFSIVAASTFGDEMAAYPPPASDDWRDWVTGYARAVHAALLKHPETAAYVRLSFGTDAAAFAPVEGLLAKLLGSRFQRPRRRTGGHVHQRCCPHHCAERDLGI